MAEEKKKIYSMIMLTAGEIVDIIEKEIERLGRNITNEELNILLTEEARKKDQVIAESLNKEDLDVDMITGNLREEGLKVRNLNEEQRRKEKGDQQ